MRCYFCDKQFAPEGDEDICGECTPPCFNCGQPSIGQDDDLATCGDAECYKALKNELDGRSGVERSCMECGTEESMPGETKCSSCAPSVQSCDVCGGDYMPLPGVGEERCENCSW